MAGTRINKKIYDNTYKYLVAMANRNGIAERYLQRYFKSKKRDYCSLEDVFERMIKSAQNFHMMPNVIKFYERRDDIKKILRDYDIDYIVKKYDEDKLYEKLCQKFQIHEESQSLRRWSKSVISSARFISEFEDLKRFKKFVNLFDKDTSTRWLLSECIKFKVFGFGSALACDFLKEIGYTNFSKPDVHLIKVFEGVGLSDSNERNVFEAIHKMADVCSVTPYKVDKIIWLICSGKFYKHDIKVPGERKKLIESLNRKS